jgi:hypothetical protein
MIGFAGEGVRAGSLRPDWIMDTIGLKARTETGARGVSGAAFGGASTGGAGAGRPDGAGAWASASVTTVRTLKSWRYMMTECRMQAVMGMFGDLLTYSERLGWCVHHFEVLLAAHGRRMQIRDMKQTKMLEIDQQRLTGTKKST